MMLAGAQDRDRVFLPIRLFHARRWSSQAPDVDRVMVPFEWRGRLRRGVDTARRPHPAAADLTRGHDPVVALVAVFLVAANRVAVIAVTILAACSAAVSLAKLFGK